MKLKFTFTLFATLLLSFSVFSQATGDYRSVASGNWSNAANWERFNGTTWVAAVTPPASSDGTITIRSGNNITINVATTADQIVVATGGTLSVNSAGNNLTLNDDAGTNPDLLVDGTLVLGGFNTLSGAGNILINGTFTWTSGTLQAVTTTSSSATTNLSGDFTKNLLANFTNNGVFNWGTGPSAGGIFFTNATFTNNGTINENFSSNRGFLDNGGTNAFINNGQFIKTTTFSFANNSVPFTNSATGTLSGVGLYNLNGTIVNVGSVLPGTPIGILSSVPSLVTGNTPTLNIRIEDGTGPGTGHDRLDFTSAVDISGAKLFVTANSASPVQSYTIMTAPGPNGFIGNFSSVQIPLHYTITIDNASNPSTITLTKTTVTLPVVWGGFNAISKDKEVVLSWTTLQELNTSFFVVEHSTDGINYNAIGTVDAKRNSSSRSDYSFIHKTPLLSGNNYYRIRQVDIDNRFNYSVIRNVLFKNTQAVMVQVGANPVRNSIQLNIQKDKVNLSISDFKGAVLRTVKLKQGFQNVTVQDFPAGIYQLTFYRDGVKIDSRKIIKL